MKFGIRRVRNLTLVLIIAFLTITTFEIIDLSIQVQQYYSGWVLVGLIVSLVSFYAKKKLSIIPLGPSSTWAQWHYYLGLLMLAIYLKHIEFSFPDGLVEIMITAAYFTVLLSGAIGLLINRLFARRLAYLEEEIIYERIPQLLMKLKSDVENIIVESVKQSGSTTLSDYYQENLSAYFSKPQFFFTHILGSNYAFVRVKNGLDKQLRYLNKKEAEYALELNRLMYKKNLLDVHFALQGVLKYWGMLHSPVAIIFIILTLGHIVLVYAFRGAM